MVIVGVRMIIEGLLKLFVILRILMASTSLEERNKFYFLDRSPYHPMVQLFWCVGVNNSCGDDN